MANWKAKVPLILSSRITIWINPALLKMIKLFINCPFQGNDYPIYPVYWRDIVSIH
jgi:hypothetical protein